MDLNLVLLYQLKRFYQLNNSHSQKITRVCILLQLDLFIDKRYCLKNFVLQIDPAMHELIENMSPASKVNGERNIEIEDGSKFPSSGSPYSCQKKMVMEEGDAAKKHQMPPASVMTRLILIMVWRKLIRNPNTYSSVLGLIWSLVSYRYQTKPKRDIFMQRISNQSYSYSQIFIN